MDTKIIRKSNKKKRLAIIIGISLIFLVGLYPIITHQKTLEIESNEILIGEANFQKFEDFTVVQAKVVPKNEQLINIVEGGAIKEIFVENGEKVKKNQPLAQIYNPNAELNYLTQETSIIEQINNLNTTRINIRNQELNMTKDFTIIDHDYNDAKRLFDMNQKLFDKGVISKNDYLSFKENFRYQEQRKSIIQKSIEKEKESNKIQVSQLSKSIATMEKSLEILRKNKENFLIKAPIDGVISEFDPVLGKTYTSGSSLGKMDAQDGYKFEAKVDEFYIQKVKIGQSAWVDIEDKKIETIITRVVPAIQSGQFQIELEPKNQNNINLKPGATFGIKLIFSENQKTLVIPNGSFISETKGNWIFVLNGQEATKRKIKIGRENPRFIEVLNGLKPNEKVIISNYNELKENELIILKNKNYDQNQ